MELVATICVMTRMRGLRSEETPRRRGHPQAVAMAVGRDAAARTREPVLQGYHESILQMPLPSGTRTMLRLSAPFAVVADITSSA